MRNRLERKLKLFQPSEQVGFRSGFGTNDHLLTLEILIEKIMEYNKPLVLVFVDLEKAFDTIKRNALAQCRIDYWYTRLMYNIYKTQ